MNKLFRLALLSIIILTTIHSAFAPVIDMLSFEASLFNSSGGNLIYNSTEDFGEKIVKTKVSKYG